MAFIVKLRSLTVRETVFTNDYIISVIYVYNISLRDENDMPVRILVNIYMPFGDGSHSNTESYVDAIDVTQSVIDDPIVYAL